MEENICQLLQQRINIHIKNSKYIKNSKNLAPKKQIAQSMDGQMNRHFSKEVQMSNNYMEKCASISVREMQIKTTLRFHLAGAGVVAQW